MSRFVIKINYRKAILCQVAFSFVFYN